MLVFVYGTLKRKEPNHDKYMKSSGKVCRYIGNAELTGKLPLVVASRHNVSRVKKWWSRSVLMDGCSQPSSEFNGQKKHLYIPFK